MQISKLIRAFLRRAAALCIQVSSGKDSLKEPFIAQGPAFRSSKQRMKIHYSPLLWLVALPMALAAQSTTPPPIELFGGYSYLSNSFNGVPGSRQALNGWDGAVAFSSWKGLRFKFDVSGTFGSNLGASQRSYSILGGPQYERSLGRERIFAHALFGETGMNRNWGAGGTTGATAAFTTLLGGGLDTPVSRHLAIRVEADSFHENLYLVRPPPTLAPYRIPGLPNFFGRFSTGIVWIPRLGSANDMAGQPVAFTKHPVESELVFESTNSFGHYHVFGITWWSYLNVAGLEYDRHSWGRFIGARMDYVAEILPVVILRQPSKTDIWGNPHSSQHTTVPGLGISPIGVRLLWRDDKRWKPYYIVKGGIIGFTQKALSQYASYEDFTLQQNVGIQFKLTDRWDFRAGLSDFHFSNGFVVPSNPGIDEMAYSGGLSYHFRSGDSRF